VAMMALFQSPVAKGNENTSTWIRFSYLVAALSSTTGHIYAVGKIATSSDPKMSLIATYVPKTFTGSSDGLTLVDGPWLFLQYDLIIIALSSLSWAYILVSDLSSSRNRWELPRICLFVLGFVVLGAGGTVSFALLWREGELQRRRDVETGNTELNNLPKKTL
jgi:hypothetical protein